MTQFKYHVDGTKPTGEEIFVFGSNLAGFHGAGAAREAVLNYGAVYGKPYGLYGKSFAIPTKGLKIENISLHKVTPYIVEFCLFTYDRPDLTFWVTAIGCGLAGFDHSEIAPLFRSANTNCNFPDVWQKYLE